MMPALVSKSKQAEPITPDEEALLWLKGEVGFQSARALHNTDYFYNSNFFWQVVKDIFLYKFCYYTCELS